MGLQYKHSLIGIHCYKENTHKLGNSKIQNDDKQKSLCYGVQNKVQKKILFQKKFKCSPVCKTDYWFRKKVIGRRGKTRDWPLTGSRFHTGHHNLPRNLNSRSDSSFIYGNKGFVIIWQSYYFLTYNQRIFGSL